MRRSVALCAAVVLSAGGFAVASILATGSLGALDDVTNTVTVVATNTLTVVTTVVSGTTQELTTSTTPRGRGVVVCGRFGRGDRFTTRIVAQGNLRGSLRGGGHIGACVVVRRIRPVRGFGRWGFGGFGGGSGFGSFGAFGRGGR